MKSTAYLMNTSRGPVVDEVALARALRENWLAGAALDVSFGCGGPTLASELGQSKLSDV